MDNVTNIEPADNEERLLKGILEGDTETNIEPAGNKERLLKGILEKLGGGGGGATSVTLAASGDNLSGDISLADLKTALSSGVVLLSFPTDGNADERVVAEYTDDSTNGLRIGVFSEDEYIVYSVVDDGNDGITLTVVSEKGMPRTFYCSERNDSTLILPNTTVAEIYDAYQKGTVKLADDPNALTTPIASWFGYSPIIVIGMKSTGEITFMSSETSPVIRSGRMIDAYMQVQLTVAPPALTKYAHDVMLAGMSPAITNCSIQQLYDELQTGIVELRLNDIIAQVAGVAQNNMVTSYTAIYTDSSDIDTIDIGVPYTGFTSAGGTERPGTVVFSGQDDGTSVKFTYDKYSL